MFWIGGEPVVELDRTAHRVELDAAHGLDELERPRIVAAVLLHRLVDPLRGGVVGLRVVGRHLAVFGAVLFHELRILRRIERRAVHERRDVADHLVAHGGQDELVIAGAAGEDRLLVSGGAQLLGELQRHRPHHQREDGVDVGLERRDVGPEVLGADRRPDLLHDLAAAVLERLLEAAERFVAEGIVGRDGSDPLVALLARPLPERMTGLRRHEGRAHHVGIFLEVALPQVIGRRNRADVEHLLAGRDRRQRVARRRQHAADQHVHLVRQDELVGLGDAGVRLALIVLEDHRHLGAAELALVLVQIHLEAVEHVDAELRENAGARRDEADAQLLRRRRRAERSTAQQCAGKKQPQRRRPRRCAVHDRFLRFDRSAYPSRRDRAETRCGVSILRQRYHCGPRWRKPACVGVDVAWAMAHTLGIHRTPTAH